MTPDFLKIAKPLCVCSDCSGDYMSDYACARSTIVESLTTAYQAGLRDAYQNIALMTKPQAHLYNGARQQVCREIHDWAQEKAAAIKNEKWV